MQNRESIRWIPIGFRNRHGGRPSVKAYSFARHGLKLLLQLRKLFKASTRQSVDGSTLQFMESCFGTVKTELEIEGYENETMARKEIRGYLCYYNTRRRHSALDYLTPEEFEDAQGPNWPGTKND